jgi:hypothetical protein
MDPVGVKSCIEAKVVPLPGTDGVLAISFYVMGWMSEDRKVPEKEMREEMEKLIARLKALEGSEVLNEVVSLRSKIRSLVDRGAAGEEFLIG